MAGKHEKEESSVDHRTPLKLHTVLAFEGMSCHIEEVIGQGSNAIVYKGWYQDSLNRELRHHVLVKELFPFHPQKKIYRAEDCHIVIEPEAEDLWETHKESFEIGNKVHLRLLYDHPDMMVMGANLNSFQFNGTLYSVLGYTGGRSLQTELNKTNVSLRHTAQRMIGLLDALEAFHKSGYLHLDISPDNIMLVGQEDQERMFLIDYNSAREVGSRDGSYLSCKAGYSAPEVSTGNLDAMGFASDLYSVAAVFFRCITGRSLTLTEMLQPKAPDCQDSPLLKDMPQTVSAMVGSILKKGLHTLSRRRYQSIGQMRQEFQELLDRIDCVGVTHWSLWENGKRSVEELIKINPSLRYLKDEKKLYPIRLEQEYSMSLEQYLDNILAPEGTSGMILAQGGMGKTTLLLHTAMLQGKRYSAATPAIFYISLNGWEKADTRYIRSQILMRLRFKKEENTFDSAMHALHKLLEQPIKTKQGELPTVLLLLDGLNEVRGDIAPLVQEISELSKMAGVRILAASRTDIPELELETASLMPLNVEDIEEALGRNGLLIPQKQDVIQLLRTPLILSIYIQASEGGRQLNIQNEEELMKAYMDSLLEKEIQQLPEDSPQRWQIDVALNYVLPAIAAEVKKKGQALTERQMLKIAEQCWKILHSRIMYGAFSRWIVHSKDIFADTKTAGEWCNVIICRLLWNKLGMLAKESEDQYRIFHQAVSEHLAEAYRAISRKIRIHKAIQHSIITVIIACMLPLFQPYVRTYDDADIKRAIDWSAGGYVAYGTQYERLQELVTPLLKEDLETFDSRYVSALAELGKAGDSTSTQTLYTQYIEEYLLPEKGSRVSWSGEGFASELAIELIGYSSQRMPYYEDLLPTLSNWSQSESAQAQYPDYPQLVMDVLEADANIVSELYHQVCAVHMVSTDELWESSIRGLLVEISQQEAHRNLSPMDDRMQYLENLRKALQEAELRLVEQRQGVVLASQEDNSDAIPSTTGGGSWVRLTLAQNKLYNTFDESLFYSDDTVFRGLEHGILSCNNYIAIYSALKEMTVSVLSGDTNAYFVRYSYLSQLLSQKSQISSDSYQFLDQVKQDGLPEAGRKVAWSYLPFDWELLEQLIHTPEIRAAYYESQLSQMEYWINAEDWDSFTLFLEVLEADLAMVREMYYICCGIHLNETYSAQALGLKEQLTDADLFPLDRIPSILDMDKALLRDCKANLESAESNLSAQTENYIFRVSLKTWT